MSLCMTRILRWLLIPVTSLAISRNKSNNKIYRLPSLYIVYLYINIALLMVNM
ncbi:hypothetical protein T492DRAFT_899135 [Pavlovales sp. CCMP2436]|nr:hypothetical protein T492DRAFT_899135 [Pavlovales sp. CCMP2436]